MRQEDLGFFAVLSTGSPAAIASMTEPSATVPIAGAFIAAAEAGWNVWRIYERIDRRSPYGNHYFGSVESI
jgi:hypothetical protein